MTDLFSTNKNQSISIIAAISLTFGAYYLFKNSKNKKNGFKEIPIPKLKLPYVGHIPFLSKNPGHVLLKWHKELGPIINLKMGIVNFITISDPFMAHELFASHGQILSDRPYNTYLTEYYGNGRGISFTKANKKWKNTRSAALLVLAPRKVDEFTDLIMFEADNLINQLLESTKSLGQFNPMKHLQATTLNVILTTTFGQRVSSIHDPLFIEIVDCIDKHMELSCGTSDLSGFLPILSFLDFLLKNEHEMKQFVTESYRPTIRKLAKEATESDKDCFYKRFLKLKDDYDLDDHDLLITMTDCIGAGTDTTAITLSWSFALLAYYPEIQEKLRKEIDEFIIQHDRFPTFQEQTQVPYFIAFIKEVLRFRPITPFGLSRITNEDVIIRDYFIPKGSVLLTSMIAMHMNPDIYEDPETFNPDRFLKDNQSMSSSANGNIHKRDQYNFGWGRRICPGIYLSEKEMFYILTRAVANGVVKLPLDENGNEVLFDINGVKDNGIVIHPMYYEIRYLHRKDKV